MTRVWEYLRPYRKLILGVVVLTFINSLGELYLPNLMSKIVDIGILRGNRAYVIDVGLKMLLVAFLSTGGMVLSAKLSADVAMGVSKDLRMKVFDHVEGFSLGEFNNLGTSSLITRNINDINQIQQFLLMLLRMMLRAPFMLIGGFLMALTTNRVLSRVLVFTVPLLLGTVLIVGRKAFPIFLEVQDRIDRLNLVLREKLTGVRIVRAFDRTSYEEERFDRASRNLSKSSLKVGRLMASMQPLVVIILNFTIIGVIGLGSKQVDLGNMNIGDLMAFIQYIGLIMFSMIMLSVVFIVFPRAAASASRIIEVLETDPTIVDKGEVKTLGNLEELEFRDVSFAYPKAEMNTLCNINFKARPGETVAIIGSTGSGKSALVNLIPRFYDVKEGAILLNGIDLRDLSQKDLRARIGYVPQKVNLFSGSVVDNIRQGREAASLDQVKEACEIAQAAGFIERLEGGYEAQVAQGGSNFSGGQRQRLSIARAIVRRPEIYIFDDSFSALDYKTDRRLREELEKITRDSIVFIVAQRISAVQDADKIIVLDDGRIDGIGLHEDLVRSSKVYREILKSQFGGEADYDQE